MQKINKPLRRILSTCGLVVFTMCAGGCITTPASGGAADGDLDLNAELEAEALKELEQEKSSAKP
jgi:hypothetical protein